jgi:preprotein translocase subunit SecF
MLLANIYESRHYRLMIIVPVALLLLSFYFIPRIQLDSSLQGGINVQLQTNSTMQVRQLTQAVDARIPGAQASVSKSPGGLSITIATNASLAGAETRLLAIYGEYGNYTQYSVNATLLQEMLSTQMGNLTLQSRLAASKSGMRKSLSQLNASLYGELSELAPFMGGRPGYNSTSADSMLALAKGANSNASAVYEAKVVSTLKGIIPFTSYSYDSVTATLGSFFLQQMQSIIIWAFILMAVSVFVVFRNPIPSVTVVFGAASDILVSLGAMGLFGIPLGVASIGGILMLLGYSMDTDILTAIRILKRTEGTSTERAYSSMKTGVTMTISAILSFSILFIVSYLTFIPTYFEISGVVLIGLFTDVITTWMCNAPLVLWYKQRKEVGR